MDNLKHIGRMRATGRKVLVAYRTLPGESDSALVIQTEALSSAQHDAMMKLVESPAGQNAYEFAEVLARARFPEGGVMLNTLHFAGKLTKVKTSDVEMTPNTRAVIGLDQLNQIIAEQRGISVNDLALGNQTSVQEVATAREVPQTMETVEEAIKVNEEPLTDDELAKRMRSDADRLYKEAARLRAEAEKLSPIKKKVPAET